MNSDDFSSASNSTSIASTRYKTVSQYVVLANKECKYDQLGGRINQCIQSELSSDNNRFQGIVHIENNDAFLSAIERLQKEAQSIPSCKGICACIVEKCRPSLVPLDMNVNEGLVTSNIATQSETYCMLAASDASTPALDNRSNALSIIMSNQMKVNKNSTKHGFEKKCRDGYSTYCKIFTDSLESDGITSCQTSKEAESAKNLGYALAKGFFLLDGYISKMNRICSFELPPLFADIMGQTEATVIMKVLNKKKITTPANI